MLFAIATADSINICIRLKTQKQPKATQFSSTRSMLLCHSHLILNEMILQSEDTALLMLFVSHFPLFLAMKTILWLI